MLKSVWINELTWEDIGEYLNKEDLVIIPIGSTEQHGPCGPLGVDTYAAIAIAEDAAKESGVLVAPPMWYGDAPHHLDFPGTISLRSETLIAVVKDIVYSLERNGFKRFIIVNGHKGTNLAPLTIACRDLKQYELPDIHIALTDPLYLATKAKDIKDDVEHHAGELEISHVWYKHPHLIKGDKLQEHNVDLSKEFSNYVKPDLFGKDQVPVEVFWNSKDQRRFAPTGAFSASDKASPEKGKEYHENMVENLVQFINWFRTIDNGGV